MPAALLTLMLATAPAFAEPALWKVSDADSHVWLFGSVHVLDWQRDWRTPQFDAALDQAELVYFELMLDANAFSEMTQLSFSEGLVRKGESLDDYLTDEQSARLEAIALEIGIEYRTLRRLRPWLAEMTLIQSTVLGSGLEDTVAGVEILISDEIADARERGLETPRFQLELFYGRPAAEQVDSLMATAEAIASGTTDQASLLTEMVELWLAGDTAQLQEAIVAEFGGLDTPLYQRLIVDRNRNWVQQIEGLLADNENVLIIVGAGHLVGPVAVQALLEERGYTVTLESAPPEGDAPVLVTPR